MSSEMHRPRAPSHECDRSLLFNQPKVLTYPVSALELERICHLLMGGAKAMLVLIPVDEGDQLGLALGEIDCNGHKMGILLI